MMSLNSTILPDVLCYEGKLCGRCFFRKNILVTHAYQDGYISCLSLLWGETLWQMFLWEKHSWDMCQPRWLHFLYRLSCRCVPFSLTVYRSLYIWACRHVGYQTVTDINTNAGLISYNCFTLPWYCTSAKFHYLISLYFHKVKFVYLIVEVEYRILVSWIVQPYLSMVTIHDPFSMILHKTFLV